MCSKILDGRRVAGEIRKEITDILAGSGASSPPRLAIILVGDDTASKVYVSHKQRDCKEVGFEVETHCFSPTVSEDALLSFIRDLNARKEVDGLIVQLPLPAHISKHRVVDCIAPGKDVDGFHHLNFGRLGTGLSAHVPATPNGIMELFSRYGISLKGKHAVVVGRSYLVGLPMSILLLQQGNATVTVTHIHTEDLSHYTRQADILISAVGKPSLIDGGMVKEGAVVVDVGITRVSSPSHSKGYVLRGDIDFDSVLAKARYITPVPNGVGPMTRAALLMNTLRAWNEHKEGRMLS